ncbi:hypothetical protein ACFXTH_027837 [Malus domestica]
MYIHWESCTHACTNASITLQAKYEFKRNPVTYAYIDWWLKLAPFDYASVAHLQDGPATLAIQHPFLSS